MSECPLQEHINSMRNRITLLERINEKHEQWCFEEFDKIQKMLGGAHGPSLREALDQLYSEFKKLKDKDED